MNVRAGSVTRLIDVVLIILIGFLGIADLDERTRIPLPTGWEAVLDTLRLEERRLLVTAAGGEQFQVELLSSLGLRMRLGEVAGADTLAAVVGRLKEQHELSGVDIEVEPDAPVQAAVHAVDACELYELDRNLEFKAGIKDTERETESP